MDTGEDIHIERVLRPCCNGDGGSIRIMFFFYFGELRLDAKAYARIHLLFLSEIFDRFDRRKEEGEEEEESSGNRIYESWFEMLYDVNSYLFQSFLTHHGGQKIPELKCVDPNTILRTFETNVSF